MVYSELDLISLVGDEDDTNVPDRPEDIKPLVHRSRNATEEDTEEEEEDGGNRNAFGDPTEWNLRKCSAASLDELASTFEEEVLPILLPLLHQQLNDENWLIRESGILALGAIAEGCITPMAQNLSEVMPFLLQNTRSDQVMLFIFFKIDFFFFSFYNFSLCPCF